MALTFVLNGVLRREADAAPSTTVLDYLRERRHLTGTKEGCAEGDCGACTIALGRREADGAVRWRAVNACLLQLVQLDGALVRTVEGLAGPDGLDRAQRLLADGDGTQCGFCTPGIVMSMHALDRAGGPADDADIHEALAGNLCRCTGYRPIIDACRILADAPAAEREAARARDAAEAALLDGVAPNKACRAGGQLHLMPRSLAELVAARADHPDAVVVAGGTDLGLGPSRHRRPIVEAVWTGAVAELREISEDEAAVALGAAVTYGEALAVLERAFPAFGALIRRIGSRQIRALGTLGGNLGTASPVGDTLPVLIALDAEVELCAADGAGGIARRGVKVADFIEGYRRTALAPGEVIATLRIPRLGPGERLFAYKVSRRHDQDISTLLAAFRLTVAGGRLASLSAAFGGMADRAKRAPALEACLLGAPWTGAVPDGIAAALAQDFTPLSDHRAGAAYRRAAAAGLVRRLALESAGAAFPLRLEAL